MTQFDSQNQPLMVSSEVLSGCHEAAQDLGIDLSPILKEHGIAPGLLTAPKHFLTHFQIIDFLQAVADRFDCQHFGFLVGKYQPPMRFGVLEQVLRLSPDVQSALERAMSYESLYTQLAGHSLELEHGYVKFIRWDRQPCSDAAVQLHTLGIVQLYKILKALCGERWHATLVSFSHTAPKAKQQYRKYFNCPVDFDREFDGIIFPENDLSMPIPTANAELLEILCNYLDKQLAEQEKWTDVVRSVRTYIRLEMGSNSCNLEDCARSLNIHPRTLQRRLSKYDTTFRELFGEARMQLAELHLQNSAIKLAELTEILGYRNRTALTRAFKDSHGESPEKWRNRRA